MRRNPRCLSALFAVALVATSAFAQQVTPPAPAPPRQTRIPQAEERTLPNGLRVIVVPKHDVPLVSARLVIKTGSEADFANEAGLAQMTAALLTQGTKTRSAAQIAREVEALGSSIESDAGWDESWVALTVMSPRFARAMEYVGDVVRNPTFKTDEIERVRQQSIDAVRVAMQEPQSLARFVSARVVFGETPYGHSVGGTPESLARISRTDIVSFHSGFYRPANAVLVVAGDVAPAEAFRIAENVFGSWNRPDEVPPTDPDAVRQRTPMSTTPRVVVIDDPEAGQAAVVVTRRGLRRVDPQYFAAGVANAILGGGYSSRLNEEIRVKRGLTYGAGSGFDLRRDVGPFTAATQTKNESAAEVAGIIVDEMTKLGTGDVAEPELTPRKAVLIGNFGRSLETSSGIADRISGLALFGLPLDEINRYVAGVQAVTSAQVKEFAAAQLPGASANVVIVGDAKKFLEPLRQRFGADKVEVIPVSQLDLNAPDLKKK